jgi:hypothetical protein
VLRWDFDSLAATETVNLILGLRADRRGQTREQHTVQAKPSFHENLPRALLVTILELEIQLLKSGDYTSNSERRCTGLPPDLVVYRFFTSRIASHAYFFRPRCRI